MTWVRRGLGGPPLSRSGLDKGGLWDSSCVPTSLAWTPTGDATSRAEQAPRPLRGWLQPLATPNPDPPRGAGPAHCRQTPHTPGTGPSGIQSRRPWCPQVHCLDCHLPWGCSRVCAPEPHTPQGCGWHPALEAGPSSHPVMLGVLGQPGPELELHRSASPSPCHAPDSRQCRPCQASRGALGGQGGLEVPLSEMEKHY